MRALMIFLACLGIVASLHGADAVTGKVVKVLPFVEDQQGRIAKSPSLYDRDAYQAYLRQFPTNIFGMRFDVLWKAGKPVEENLKLAVELRGVATNSEPRLQTLETNLVPNGRQWTQFTLTGDDYKNFGSVVAWRVRLWDGNQMLGEQKSFLW